MNGKTAKWGLSQILVIVMLVMAGSAFAAGEALLHNSQTTGSTKWGGNWGVSGGQYGAFTCTTCHTTTTSNVKRIVESIPANIGPGVIKPVTFNNMTGFGDEAAHATSTKICEVCHTATTTHQYNTSNAPQSGATAHYGLNCMDCHQHSDGFKKSVHVVPLYATSAGHASCGSTGIGCHQNSNPAAAYPAVPSGSAPDCRSCHAKADPTVALVGCGSCHGSANGTGEPNGTVYPDVAGSHSLHTPLAACTSCHDTGGTGGNANHGKGNRGANPAVVNLAASLTWNGTTCASASCHPNPYGSGSAATPVWGTTGNGCNACHSAKPIGVNGPATGSHGGLHAGLACTSCHAAGTTTSTAPSTGHKDGNITIVNVNYATTVAPHTAGTGYSSCSNFYCHSNGTAATGPFTAKSAPTWGGSVSCVSCHGGGRGGAQFSSISSGRHLKHINSTYAYNYGCATCHAATASNNTTILDAAKHVNQQIDVTFSGTAVTGGAAAVYATTGHAPAVTGTVDQSCSNVYCHSNAQTGGQPGTNFYFRNLTGAKRFNQTTTLSLGCSGCHSTGSTTSGKWTLSGAHLNHLSLTINSRIGKVLTCSDCHANGGSNLNRANHANGMINYSGALSGNASRGNLKLSTGRCNTVYCHSNGQGVYNNMSTIAWFSGATLDCNGCHADKAGAVSLSGKHNAHLNSGASTGGMFDCINCHASTLATSTTLNASGNHVNALKNFSGAKAYKTGFVPGAGTCSTYCHTDGKGNAVAPPLWTDTTTTFGGTAGACAGCHGNSGTTLTTGAHPAHLNHSGITCANCHFTTTNNGTSIAGTGATHIDGTVSIQSGSTFNGSSVSFTPSSPGCNNISCHGGANAPDWRGTLNCDACHPKTGLSGAHQVHMGALDLTSASIYYNMTANRTPANSDSVRKHGFGCASCHPMDKNANHINGTVDIDMNRVNVAGVGTLRFLNHSSAGYDKNGTKKCSNIYCHSNASRMESESNAKANTSLAWTDTYANHPELDRCAQCHGNQPTTGAHAAHSVGVHTFNDGVMIDGNIYNGVSGKLPIINKPNTAHGNPNNSTTIGCYICHFGTITTAANDKNTKCVVCHYTGNPRGAALKGNASIANLKNHVNGMRDVQFNPIQVMSKAQVRPKGASKTSNSGFDFYSAVWTRTSYKSMSTLSYDKAKLALDTASMWHPGAAMASSCTNIACHNGRPVNWNLANFNDPNKCMDCHNAL